MDVLGIFAPKPRKMPTHPTYSQALSGLVKCVRLRRPQEAIYWLKYLHESVDKDVTKQKDQHKRTARRLAILTNEDGMSISVMEKTCSKLKTLEDPDVPLVNWAAEVVRICKLPNWWSLPEGRDYIYQSLRGVRYFKWNPSTDRDYLMQIVRDAVDHQERVIALGAMFQLNDLQMGTSKQAEFLQSIAEDVHHEPALRLLAIQLANRSALAGDNNFITQAIWYLCGGNSDLKDKMEPVIAGEVYELINNAEIAWLTPHPIPDWCCDGIHCAGNDPRFAGHLPCMWSVCAAYLHYGRVEPTDKWLPEFYTLDGLKGEKL